MYNMIFVCRCFKNMYLKFWTSEQTWTIGNYMKSKMQRYITKMIVDDLTFNIPLHLSHLSLTDDFNQVIAFEGLPPHLLYLTFGYFNQVIATGILPPNLLHLTFGCNFNQIINVGVLPLNLSHLTFGYEFNQVIAIGVLPLNLSHLTFGYKFNQIIQIGMLPPILSHLHLPFDTNVIKLFK